MLSGIGFTISLFIVDLAIDDPRSADLARVGVLAASVIAFALGWAFFRITDRLSPPAAVGLKLVRAIEPERDHLRGPVDAPLTLVEYGDFECPFCSRATGSIDEVRAYFGDELCYVGGISRSSGSIRVPPMPPGPVKPPPCRASSSTSPH